MGNPEIQHHRIHDVNEVKAHPDGSDLETTQHHDHDLNSAKLNEYGEVETKNNNHVI
jgi:hypothetical protein